MFSLALEVRGCCNPQEYRDTSLILTLQGLHTLLWKQQDRELGGLNLNREPQGEARICVCRCRTWCPLHGKVVGRDRKNGLFTLCDVLTPHSDGVFPNNQDEVGGHKGKSAYPMLKC